MATDLLPTSTSVIVALALSFGNILYYFPEFLMYIILPYIVDRTVFNLVVSCNRDTHKKIKAIVLPLQKIINYQLLGSFLLLLGLQMKHGVVYRCSSAFFIRDVIKITD